MRLCNYKRIRVEMTPTNVSEQEVESAITRALDEHALSVDVSDRAVKDGDTVIIDFEGSVDGVPFDGGKAEQYELIIGSGMFIPGFEEQLVGMTVGKDRVIHVTFPTNYVASLAGKAADFAIRLHAIKVKKRPELCDAFVSSLGIEGVTTVSAWFDKVANELWDKKEEDNRKRWYDAVVDKLVDECELDVPDAMVEAHIDGEVEQFKEIAQHYGFEANEFLRMVGLDTFEAYREQVREQSYRRCKLDLILAAITREEGFTVSREEIDATYKSLSEQKSIPEDAVRASLGEDDIRAYVLRSKAIDLVYQYPSKYALARLGSPEAQRELVALLTAAGELDEAAEWQRALDQSADH